MTVKMQIDVARYSKLISQKNTGHNDEKEEKLLERCPPGHEGTKLVDKPATIIDASGTIITWYLPDALTETTQKKIRAATNLLGPSLKKGSENVGSTPGCINLSLAWFQQGHENLSDPEVSASLKGPSSKNILKAIARPAAITSAALRMPETLQYWASVFNSLSIISNWEPSIIETIYPFLNALIFSPPWGTILMLG
ncbi:hypothetical protein BDR07DRAFT_1484138 [Suillus spraguei]|nr:hypothetical protein BDR07DRAFT_1484138 [Suillus spraguei]